MSKKVTDLTLLATPDSDDVLLVEDISANTTKKTTVGAIQFKNPYCFRAYAAAATTLTDNTDIKILVATESYDYNNNFASSTYTAPVAGVYHFSANFQIDGAVASGVNGNASIWVNGAIAIAGGVYTSITFGAYSVSGDILLAAGNTVDFYGKQDSAGAEATLPGSATTWFSGHLVHAT